MGIIVGSARKDENGSYIGGKAGDGLQKSSQNDTIGEVSMQAHYIHSKGWYGFRFINVSYANAMAEAMKQACDNPNIGYDQGDRLDIMVAIKKYGTMEKIAEPTECDCSSLIRACIYQATGVDVGNFNTASQPSVLTSSNLFQQKFSVTAQTTVYNGDILVTKTKGHTVAVVSGNPRIESSVGNAIGTAVAKTSMMVRKGAGTGYGKCGTVKKGETVEVLEILSNGWYKIVWKDADCGYAYTSNASGKYYSYTAKQQSSSQESTSSANNKTESAKSKNSTLSGRYKVTASGLYLRAGAGKSKQAIVVMKKDTIVNCYGYYTEVDGVKWLYVQVVIDGVTYTGFCSSSYLVKC